MIDDFKQNALGNGEEGRQWMESIPGLVSKYRDRWGLEVFPPFNLSYNYVAPALRADGTRVVLKIGFPKDREFQTEIKALRIFDGEGAVKMLEAVEADSVILLEHVSPGEPLSAMADDEAVTRILAGVINKLHKPLPENHEFITVSEWSIAFPQLREKFEDSTGPLPSYLVDKAEQLFEELIATSAQSVLCHGDLHQDNILSSDRGGWLAIDPKGIAAEPAYDVAAMIRNPYEKLKDITNLEPLLRQRIEIISQELELDPKRIYKWCLAQTVLSAVWNVESAKGHGHAGRVAEVLYKMKF